MPAMDTKEYEDTLYTNLCDIERRTIIGSSGDTIREPRLLDAIARTDKLPHDADNASFDQTSRQDDEAGEKWMAVEHHFFAGKKKK